MACDQTAVSCSSDSSRKNAVAQPCGRAFDGAAAPLVQAHEPAARGRMDREGKRFDGIEFLRTGSRGHYDHLVGLPDRLAGPIGQSGIAEKDDQVVLILERIEPA